MNQELLEQHRDIYMKAIRGLIINNTTALVNDDLLPLFQAPPLEAMDTIKQKLLTFAKSYHLVLDSEKIDKILSEYRMILADKMKDIGSYRQRTLIKKLDDVNKDSKDMTFKILKKDLVALDKNIKKDVKSTMSDNSLFIIQNATEFFTTSVLPEKLITDLTKFFKNVYPKQMIDMIDMKILVKDTTLINGIKEQTERFIFTKENSHLFD